MTMFVLSCGGWLMTAIAMGLLWRWQSPRGQYAVVDVAWTLAVSTLGIGLAVGSVEGTPSRRIVVAGLIATWGWRLSAHLAKRLRRLHRDGRYEAMQQAWGASTPRRMFWFFQYQAFGAWLFALPVGWAASNPSPFGWNDWLAIAIGMVALLGEGVADRQLARFRQTSTPGRRVCDVGLWRYSRHPNYFFEWLHWWAYVAFAATAPWGWLAVLGPAAMLYFILFVTGIPPTEAQALRTRGEEYRDYQRRTSAFVPWPPRDASSRGGGEGSVLN